MLRGSLSVSHEAAAAHDSGHPCHLSTNELLQSSANPLDTPDSTVRPSPEAVEDQIHNSPRSNGTLPQEVLKTEANPIDSPDSTVRPPFKTVLPQPQDRPNSGKQQGVPDTADTNGLADTRDNCSGRADVSSFLSEQGRAFRPAGITSLICEFEGLKDVVALHGGLPPTAAFPITGVTLTLADSGTVVIDDPTLVGAAQQYNTSTGGYEPLRVWAEEMVERLHSPPSPHDVTITTGSNHAVDLMLGVLLDRGDPLLVEEYTYPHMLEGVVESKGYVPLSVSMDEDGFVPSALRQVLSERRASDSLPQPRVLFTVPTGQNPTGLVMSLQRRREVYQVACDFDLLIIEDDPYVFLQFNNGDIPGLRNLGQSFLSLDTQGRVLRFDSCSKFLAPGFRIGWAALPPLLASKLGMAQFASSLGPNPFSQVMLSQLLKKWGYEGLEAHVRKTQLEYWHRASAMHKAATKELAGLAEWVAPCAGMFLWLRVLKAPRDESALVAAMRRHKVVVVPGRIGHARGRDPSFRCPYLRMAWSYCAHDDLSSGMVRLGAALRDCLE